MNNTEELKIIGIGELQEILCIGRSSAYKLLNSKAIRAYKTGRNWRIPMSSVKEYVTNACCCYN